MITWLSITHIRVEVEYKLMTQTSSKLIKIKKLVVKLGFIVSSPFHMQ